MCAQKRGLGRGLDALFPSKNEGLVAERELDIDRLRPNPHQPRVAFDETALSELAASIHRHGVLQPLIVREVDDGYEVVAGERRWRAAQKAGLRVVPVVVRDLDDREMTEIALIENLQREDLNPLETARAYETLMQEFDLDQEAVAERVGKSRSAVANSVRLLALEPDIQARVEGGTLSEGHARALLAFPAGEARRQAARRIVERGLTVRQAEALARQAKARSTKATTREQGAEASDANLRELERRLKESLAAPVKIHHGRQRGTVEIGYFGNEDLERLVFRLTQA